jgi:uncharacterized membrane protein SpoIIM required for sporulation/ABC-type transport system involved in multi-copper enzyme maturation permease subunit
MTARLGALLFSGVRRPRWNLAWLVARRDLRESTSDARLFIAMTSLTFVIPVVAVAGVSVAARLLGSGSAGIAERLVEVGAFFVVFLPASFSLVLALESFSGERERNTLETLFATRLRESEIYLGKVFAVLLPSLALSYSALLVYTVGVLAIDQFIPTQELGPLVVVTLAQALVMVCGATIVSSQTKTLRSANVMASFIIIPMSGVIQGESVLIITHLEWILWAVATMLAVVALLLLRLGMIGFNRESILAKESAPPNRRAWLGRALGPVPGPRRWPGLLPGLPRAVGRAFGRTRSAIAVAAALLLAGTAVGAVSERLSLIDSEPVRVLVSAQVSTGQELVFGTPQLFAFIFGHNLLVGLLMLVLAPATLGVLGGLVLMTNGFVIGYLGAVFFGFSRLDYFACGTLPHGVFELVALVLAYAFALRVGASMVRPSSAGWLAGMRLAFGDYARGALVFVPLFAVAALVESYVTPLVLRGC